MTTNRLVPAVLLAGYVALFIWGAINPYDRATWWAENIPIVILVGALVVMYLRGVPVDHRRAAPPNGRCPQPRA